MTATSAIDPTIAIDPSIPTDPASTAPKVVDDPVRALGLDADQLAAFAEELDAIRARVESSLGAEDVAYLDRLIRVQRALEVAGRAAFFVGFWPPAWVGGVAALSLAKILDNMEIGHNVMHGQYDWVQDDRLAGARFEWDTDCPASQWRHTHNVIHHAFTNVRGVDRDLGYGVLRMDPDEPWRPKDLGNPLYALVLAVFFQYGVMLHDLEVERIVSGERTWAETAGLRAEMRAKLGRQTLKDYVVFPLLTGPSAPLTFAGNALANLTRNLWAFTIIFCGHFPDGTVTFPPEVLDDDSRGAWYLRQVLGSANISGGPLFHVLSGNLSHQIEHHLFPDLPARRYAEIAPEVRAICERYGVPYRTGGLARQFGSVVARICRLALPGR